MLGMLRETFALIVMISMLMRGIGPACILQHDGRSMMTNDSTPGRWGKPHDFRGLILIVDDLPTNLKVLRGILGQTDYQLTFVSSGEQALERVKLAHPDLILLDLMMPDMDGLEVCQRLKQNSEYADIPIIFLTASHELEHLVEAFKLGAVDYVTKPFRTPELLSRIHTHLTLQRLQKKSHWQTAQEKMMRQIIESIHSSLDLPAILANAVAEIQAFWAVERVFVCRRTSSTTCDVVASSDDSVAVRILLPSETRESIGQLALEQVNQLDGRDLAWLQFWQAQGELRLPLWSQDRLWGYLMLQYSTQAIFSRENEQFLKLMVKQLQIAIERTELYGQLKTTQTQLLNTIDQLEAANHKLEQIAKYDSLTQLANRRYLDSYLEREWQRACREHQPLSAILIDIDYFKLYNDTYGHLQGDNCLKQVGQLLLHDAKRPADLVARYGGEEFVVVLPNTKKSGAIVVAQQIQTAVNQAQIPHVTHQFSDHVTISLGVATLLPDQNQSPTQLLTLADKALYQAKQTGRNCYVVSQS